MNRRNPPPPPPGLGDPEVKGQAVAMRAFEIALAGGHSIAVVGPMGSGRHYLTGEVFPNVARAVLDSCPCGQRGGLRRACTCTADTMAVHYAVLEPVLVDLDIVVEVCPLPLHVWQSPGYTPEHWENFRARVRAARALAGTPLELEGDAAKRTLELVVRRMTLTCAQYVALNRVSRTIARLGGAMRGVEAKHVAEAAQYLSPAMPHYWEWTR